MAKRRAGEADLEEAQANKKPKLEETLLCSINSLPEELVMQILMRIPMRKLEHSTRIASVCSKFARLIRDRSFWKSLCMYKWGENIAPIQYIATDEPNHNDYIIPREEENSSTMPDWKKYCFYRGHFQMAVQDLNRALEGLGLEKDKLDEWADLNKNSLRDALKIFARPTLDNRIGHNYILFVCDMIAILDADPRSRKAIHRIIEALDRRVENFKYLKHGTALLSLCEKNQNLSRGVASELLHISSESFKLLLNKHTIFTDKGDLENYLKRLVDGWIQFLYAEPLLINEEFVLPEETLYFPIRILQILIKDNQERPYLLEYLGNMIVERAWKEYCNIEKNWKRKLVAIAVAQLNYYRITTEITLKMFRMALDAVKDSQEPVKISGIIFLNCLTGSLSSSVELPQDVITSTIEALLNGTDTLPHHKLKLMAGITNVLSYCKQKDLKDQISEELLNRIHSTMVTIAHSEQNITGYRLFIMRIIKTLIDFIENLDPEHYADYEQIADEFFGEEE